MSSIIKSPFVSFSEQRKTIEVIDSNNKKIINNYPSEDKNLASESNNENLTEQTEVTDIKALQEQMYQEIINKANEEAEKIIEEANKKAEQIEEDAFKKGYEDGLVKGKETGLQEVSALKLELEEDISSFNDDKNNFYRNIEPKIASIITTLVKNMIGICRFEENIIFFLIRKGLEEVELQEELIIRVSEEDFDEVIQGKYLIEENMSSQTKLEILKDLKLHKNDCIIETNLGTIDCSLDERMTGLIRQLNLIENSINIC